MHGYKRSINKVHYLRQPTYVSWSQDCKVSSRLECFILWCICIERKRTRKQTLPSNSVLPLNMELPNLEIPNNSSAKDITVADYRPLTKLGEGNVFTGVCQSFCPRRRGRGDGMSGVCQGHGHGTQRDTVGKRAVRILECFFVVNAA